MPLLPETSGGGLQSLSRAHDELYQAAAAAAHATLYTVTDYAGSGRVSQIGLFDLAGYAYNYMVVTIDGTADTYDADGVNANCASPYIGIPEPNAYYLVFNENCEFTTSLKVEIANDNVAAQNIAGHVTYAISSREINRELIPAGDKLPMDRDYTYPHDVMCITYITDHGPQRGRQSTRLIMPSDAAPEIWHKADGTPAGRLVKFTFDLTPGGPERRKVLRTEDREEVIELGGEQFHVAFEKGILRAGRLPLRVPQTIKDAR